MVVVLAIFSTNYSVLLTSPHPNLVLWYVDEEGPDQDGSLIATHIDSITTDSGSGTVSFMSFENYKDLWS